MRVDIGSHSFTYPSTPDELTLGAWIDFVHTYGIQLDRYDEELAQMEDGTAKALSAMQLFAERAYAVAAFFAGVDIEVAKTDFPLRAVTALYRAELPKCFRTDPDVQVIMWKGEEYILPDPVLTQASVMTFGEVIDSKVMLHNAQVLNWTRWELIRALCAIFLRTTHQSYEDAYSYLDSPRRTFMDELPMRGALMVSGWYEQLNKFLEEAFTVFQDSTLKSGANMKKHFAHWGWVNFLKSIAKTKVFDIPGAGLNSIDCARRSKAFDVLMYASEEKEYGEALSNDMPKPK